ncbi:type IX secretion system sortase PorU [Flammeovirgaceae bacterium SG7u.111]|nr:type IX secretion system sortase PorU [Flammeovirgaceae bacterium SG7u.132]WPO36114.1 type IX secretion system sortase PorU [Flammeovirgaceae bacterium SG7u.111]
MVEKLLYILSFVLSCHFTLAQSPKSASVLATGDVFKVGVTENGIYKIDAALLSSFGLSPASIDPAEVKVYGNGGGMLPQENAAFRFDDLEENAVSVTGGGDGAFSESDYILFYAEGADGKKVDEASGFIRHEKNVYADTNYYFIAIGQGPSTLIGEKTNVLSGGIVVDKFKDYTFHELEEVNQLARESSTAGSGRLWFGEIFELVKEHSISLNMPGIIDGSELEIESRVMAENTSPSKFDFSLNGSFYDSIGVQALPETQYGFKGRLVQKKSALIANGLEADGQLAFKIAFDDNGASGLGMLDYVLVNAWRNLQLYENEVIFRSIPQSAESLSSFQIAGAEEGMEVWDITKKTKPVSIPYSINGNIASFSDSTNTLKEYIAFSGSDFPRPEFIEKIPNQNLHGLSAPNLLIISHPDLLPQAERIAALRRAKDNLTAEIASTPQVFNEFSSGRQDVTALRDFIRMLYLRNSDEVTGLRYVLLLGDATYDYKNISGNNQANVPVYESYESLHPINSFSSDDYFGFMDEEEGEWLENSSEIPHLMEVGIGRIPARNLIEAKAVVDKLYNYDDGGEEIFGDWRNRVVLVADDEDSNTHQRGANSLADLIESSHKLFNVERLFIDAFVQESTPNGKRSPIVKEKIDRHIDNGVLILNYTGHGSEIRWASEDILTASQIQSWTNINKLPLMMTATCEFGRYDNPLTVSGAEYAILNPKGGAIGLVTTTRPVFSSSNDSVNEAFYKTVFEKDNNGEYPRLGDIIRQTKNASIVGVNNRNFALLGDPSLRLSYPKDDVVLTHINGEEVSGNDTLKALQSVKLEGEVRDLGGIVANYDGVLNVKVFDKLKKLKTLGDEGPSTVMTYYNRENLLYQGKATIANGKFAFEFVVPKDIDYQFGEGKVSLYAQSVNGLADAGGYSENLTIGGSSKDFISDTEAPEMVLYLEDSTFRNGNVVPANTNLYLELFDESGINTSGHGLGHNIEAVLDVDGDVFNLNDFYATSLDDFRKGSLSFPLYDLEEGDHSITVTAWDTHNNASEATVEFKVRTSEKLQIYELLTVPNPFFVKTSFEFIHNRIGEEMAASIMIYNSNGSFVTKLELPSSDGQMYVNKIEWDGTNQYGAPLSSGIYFYKLYLYDLETNETASKSAKLLIIR